MKNNHDQEKKDFIYKESLEILLKSDIPFMIGGAFALRIHTGIIRETKDIDIFCKASDYPRILTIFSENRYKTELTDARWIAKAYKKKNIIDLIFGTASGHWSIDDTWFRYAQTLNLFDLNLKIIGAEELIWSKAYIQDRQRFDGADIHHIILKKGKALNWKRLLNRMEAHWEILLSHILNFRFIYPSEREIIPKWLLDELLSRVKEQFTMPKVQDKVCRGHLLSRSQYDIDIKEWGFKDVT